MKIIGYFGSYSAAKAQAEKLKLDNVSIQSCGQGWQQGFTYHQWTLIDLS